MARSSLKPVTVAGIEFDALIDEQKNLSASIPSYPVEEGFPVSDTIILEPLEIQMNLYVSNTPVTWLYRHGASHDRVERICGMIEQLWFSRSLVKVVTTDSIYTNMGITSLSIKKSKEIGYAREISVSMTKVRTTQRQTVDIPSYLLKSGATKAEAGRAAVSSEPARSSSTAASSAAAAGGSKAQNPSKKSQSILYGAAKGLGFI